MSEVKTVTPEMIDDELCATMAEAIFREKHHTVINNEIQAVLWYLANNPRVPSKRDSDNIAIEWANSNKGTDWPIYAAVEWQRRAYLKREPELPLEVKALFWNINNSDKEDEQHNQAVQEAYRLGLANGGK